MTLTDRLTQSPLAQTVMNHWASGAAREGNPRRYFPGKIDEVRIWSCARTSDQITAWACQPLLEPQFGLVGLYQFDLEAGSTIIDGVSAPHNGTLFGNYAYIEADWTCGSNHGSVNLLSAGPPDWAYQLDWISGSLASLTFTNFCPGTIGSVSGAAAAAGWTVSNNLNSVVFTTSTPLTSGSLAGFMLSHPSCAAQVTWATGSSTGQVDGPLPVELATFDAVGAVDAIHLSFTTASESNNARFEIWKGGSADGEFAKLVDLPSQGNSATEHRYEYTDREVTAEQSYWYYLADVDLQGNRTEHRERMASATAASVVIPAEYALSVYPNPFNPTTTISFTLQDAGEVRLVVYDVSGRLVRELVHRALTAGEHQVAFEARDLPTGVYLVRMECGRYSATRKLLLLK